MEPPAGFDDVYKREMQEIRTLRKVRRDPTLIAGSPATKEDDAPIDDLFALAISGGGIRSATFSLGILQGLSKNGLLHRFDYLSTVSGGGYIGSWLAAWIKRTPSEAAQSSVRVIEQRLADSIADDPEREDYRPLSWLRRFSNYLTPKLGGFSADTWSMLAIWGRNTFLNLLILVGILSGGVALARCMAAMDASLGPGDWETAGLTALTLAFALLTLATAVICVNLSRIVGDRQGAPRDASQGTIQKFVVVPALLAAWRVSLALSLWSGQLTPSNFWPWFGWLTLALAPLFFCVAFFGGFKKCFDLQHPPTLRTHAALAALLVLTAVAPAVVSAGLLVALAFSAKLLSNPPLKDSLPWITVTLGPPAVMWALSTGLIIQIGLMGHDLFDSCREWLGRLRAWLLIYSMGWLGFFGISIWGPYWVASIGGWSGWGGLGLSGTWLLTTIAGLMTGASAKTSATSKGTDAPTSKITLEWIARLGPYAFMTGFLLAIAFGVHQWTAYHGNGQAAPAQAVSSDKPSEAFYTSVGGGQKVTLTIDKAAQPFWPALAQVQAVYWDRMDELAGQYLLIRGARSWRDLDVFTVLAFALAIGLSLRVNINDFSLHDFYKNRLVRCYMGASNLDRKPEAFTGFDYWDEIPMDTLRPTAPCAKGEHVYSGPLPIINTTLNVSAGKDLAWQERKGSSFIFSPLFSGFRPDPEEAEAGQVRLGYRRTFDYAYSRRRGNLKTWDDDPVKKSVELGTAVAISGAAANPNFGYHTSTAVAFLLTVFDVRLGSWLGNTINDKTSQSSGPKWGLLYLFRELFGLSDETSAYVNLSDGGHFENMGIYELVRRRCQYIVLCDGEEDAAFGFGGLANAIRKCRVDFGTEIDINVSRLSPVDRLSRAHCAVGRIKYRGQANPGYLLYIKTSITGDEPRDVLEFRDRQPSFPHQSTGDQWFDESQFESYRRLGLHVAEEVFGRIPRETCKGELGPLFAAQEILCKRANEKRVEVPATATPALVSSGGQHTISGEAQ